jgi:hypothetical protein
MSVVRGAFRVLVLILSFGLGVGSALDACLVSCHPGAVKQNARTGHCHTVSVSENGSHLQAIPSCCHDGSSGVANRNDDGRTRLIAGSSVALTSVACDGRVNLPTKQFHLAPLFDTLSISDPHQTPLRL